jgi:carboxypeptidase C (cathepsin A)
MMKVFNFVLALAVVHSARAVPMKDLVDVLPGWNHPLPSRMYSGYIDAGTSCQDQTCYSMHEHYIFIESENAPSTDPVVMWTNGGPGAASLYGLFVELGPLFLSDRSMQTVDFNQTGVPTLFRNEFAWTKFANILIINSPPPVGFSYCDPAGPSGDGYSCGSWNDTRTAAHNLIFLKNWFRAFPEFAGSDFYLTGESYAGIYVPTLARAILNDPASVRNRHSPLSPPLALGLENFALLAFPPFTQAIPFPQTYLCILHYCFDFRFISPTTPRWYRGHF